MFFISGLIHQLTSWRLNPGCSDYADLQFFCMNAVAVSLESALLRSIYPSQSSESGKRHETSGSHTQKILRCALMRLVGYTWVMSFFVWAIPRFYYLRVYCTVDQHLKVVEIVA